MRGIDRLTSFRWCYSFCDAIRLHGIFRIIHSDENKSDWFFSEATEKKSKHFLSRSLHVSGALQSIESAHIPSFIHFRLLFIHHINCNTYTYTSFHIRSGKDATNKCVSSVVVVVVYSAFYALRKYRKHAENMQTMFNAWKPSVKCLLWLFQKKEKRHETREWKNDKETSKNV